jgi:hypothetical protein
MTKSTTASALLIKTIFRLMFVFTIFSAIKVAGQGIIIDHTSTNMEEIPLTIIDDIQENIKWQYAHYSHGSQLLCGLQLIEDSNPTYSVAIGGGYNGTNSIPPYLPTELGALCIYNGNCGYTIENTNYWKPEQSNHCVENTLNANPTINVSGWQWCEELNSYSEAQVQEYLVAMNAYELQFPNVTFVYMTSNAQATGSFGYNRHLRCEQIRNYCIANNKVLYDFADLDSWYNGEHSTYLYNGEEIPQQHAAYNGTDCGHANDLNSINKGRAVWGLMARLRGWLPNSQSLNIKLFLQGNYTGSGMSTNLNSQGVLPLNQPFNIPPLNYNGGEAVQAIPGTSIVEWVMVELRDAATAQTATNNTIILQKAAFILSNGQVVDLDGSSNIQFNQTVNQQLYIVIRHRNHLGIMSAFPLTINSNIYQYDFTTGSEQSYGGSNSQIQLSPGVWGMIGGDGNLDGVIDNVDKTFTWTNTSGEAGYYAGDFNLNGNVNNQDKNLIWVINFGKTSYIP